jgi:hypothetical protein
MIYFAVVPFIVVIGVLVYLRIDYLIEVIRYEKTKQNTAKRLAEAYHAEIIRKNSTNILLSNDELLHTQ